jgi:hypothetical protein
MITETRTVSWAWFWDLYNHYTRGVERMLEDEKKGNLEVHISTNSDYDDRGLKPRFKYRKDNELLQILDKADSEIDFNHPKHKSFYLSCLDWFNTEDYLKGILRKLKPFSQYCFMPIMGGGYPLEIQAIVLDKDTGKPIFNLSYEHKDVANIVKETAVMLDLAGGLSLAGAISSSGNSLTPLDFLETMVLGASLLSPFYIPLLAVHYGRKIKVSGYGETKEEAKKNFDRGRLYLREVK